MKDTAGKPEEKKAGTGIGRGDFLKALATGVGAAGLGAFAGGQAFADMQKKGK
jgi:hypothetical protein